MTLSEVDEIRAHGWRQGSVIEGALARQILDASSVGNGATYVIVSQDCDVVNRSFEVEPTFEVIAAPVRDSRPDPRFAHGKNPRRLHLSWQEGGRLEFDVQKRAKLARTLLALHGPASALDSAGTRLLAGWLAKRYARPAFPDTFNERIRPAAKKVDSGLKRFGEHASGVFLLLNSWEELYENSLYEVIIVVVSPIATLDEKKRRGGRRARNPAHGSAQYL